MHPGCQFERPAWVRGADGCNDARSPHPSRFPMIDDLARGAGRGHFDLLPIADFDCYSQFNLSSVLNGLQIEVV